MLVGRRLWCCGGFCCLVFVGFIFLDIVGFNILCQQGRLTEEKEKCQNKIAEHFKLDPQGFAQTKCYGQIDCAKCNKRSIHIGN